MKKKWLGLMLAICVVCNHFGVVAIASDYVKEEQVIKLELGETIQGLNNIEDRGQVNNTLQRSGVELMSCSLAIANTAKGIYMQTEISLLQDVSKLGAYNKILQEKHFFGFSSKEMAPEHYDTNTSISVYGHTFVYREVGKTYRVKATQYYEYGGQTYEFQNETPSFTYEI